MEKNLFLYFKTNSNNNLNSKMIYSDANKIWLNRAQTIDDIDVENMHHIDLNNDLLHKSLYFKSQFDQAKLKGDIEAKMDEINYKTLGINNEHEKAIKRLTNEDAVNKRENNFKNMKEYYAHEERMKNIVLDGEDRINEAYLKMTKENINYSSAYGKSIWTNTNGTI